MVGQFHRDSLLGAAGDERQGRSMYPARQDAVQTQDGDAVQTHHGRTRHRPSTAGMQYRPRMGSQYGPRMGSEYGPSTAGHGTDPGWGCSTDPGWGRSTDPGWGRSTDPSRQDMVQTQHGGSQHVVTHIGLCRHRSVPQNSRVTAHLPGSAARAACLTITIILLAFTSILPAISESRLSAFWDTTRRSRSTMSVSPFQN